IAALRFFAERLQDDIVEIAAKRFLIANCGLRIGPGICLVFRFCIPQSEIRNRSTWLRWLLLTNSLRNLISCAALQFVRTASSQQFIKQHSERIDVTRG